MLEEFIFSHLVSKDVIKRFQFPDESEDDPQKREVYQDGHKELPEDIGEETEEKDDEVYSLPFVITPPFLIAFQMTFSERHLHSCYSY